jgi:hypothetical protein
MRLSTGSGAHHEHTGDHSGHEEGSLIPDIPAGQSLDQLCAAWARRTSRTGVDQQSTKGLKVHFAYGNCGIRYVNVLSYVASARHPRL